METVNRFRPMPGLLLIFEGHSLVLANRSGFIDAGIEGFYHRKTRFLSKFSIAVDRKKPKCVSANEVDSYSAIAYYLAPSPAGRSAGPEPDNTGSDGGEIVEKAIEIQINRFVASGLHHDMYVTNHAMAEAKVVLSWEVAADFADMAEADSGKRRQTAPVERHWLPSDVGGTLAFRYRHPELGHGTEIRFSGSGQFSQQDGAVACTLSLPPHVPVNLNVDVVPIFCGARVEPRAERRSFGLPPAQPGGQGRVTVTTSDPVVQRVWNRAVSDLASLPLLEGEGFERLTPAAGVPKYVALFGRDVLVTSWQGSLVSPEMLRGTLQTMAKWQGRTYDDRFDEEPGKHLHQHQLSPLSLLEKEPFRHYYGDYSAPGLFLVGLAWDLAVTGDRDFFLSMRDPILRTLDWMDRDGDKDGDGFYEYQTRAGAWGEKNQGWKDSEQAVLYENGRMVDDPVALVEIQGCYYAAKHLIGLAFASVGERERGAALLQEAEALKRRFNEVFWIPEQRYFGLALDPGKALVKTIAADAGQCLAYGIVADDRAADVAARLMAPDLFSGWGIRTLSSEHPGFNPFAYHLGSVWPSANSLIAFGLKRHGFNARLHQLAKSLFDASQLFSLDRFPEVFGGQSRDARHPHPGIYPDANWPQAWSAGAVVLLLQSMLGLLPMAPLGTLIVDPDLPPWLPDVTVENIRVGAAQASLRFRRDASGATHHEIIDGSGSLKIHRPAPAERREIGRDRFAAIMRDVLRV